MVVMYDYISIRSIVIWCDSANSQYLYQSETYSLSLSLTLTFSLSQYLYQSKTYSLSLPFSLSFFVSFFHTLSLSLSLSLSHLLTFITEFFEVCLNLASYHSFVREASQPVTSLTISDEGCRHSSVGSSVPSILPLGFESQAHHLPFYQFILICVMWKRRKLRKEAGIGPSLKRPVNLVTLLVT